MVDMESDWSLTLFFIADLHGWIYPPTGYTTPGLAAIGNSISYQLEMLPRRHREGLNPDNHQTALLLGGDTFAYESPACSSPQLVMNCIVQLGGLVDSMWALVGNHELYLLQYGDLATHTHTHPNWLFASDLRCSLNGGFAAPGAGDLGPCCIVGHGGGGGNAWACRSGGQIQRHTPAGATQPYILALHVGDDKVRAAHAQAIKNPTWLCTLAGHNHYGPADGDVDLDEVVETPPYGIRMLELWLDMQNGKLIRRAHWRSPGYGPETPVMTALTNTLLTACTNGGWLHPVANLSAPMPWDGDCPSQPDTLGGHILLSQYRVASRLFPECAAVYLHPSSVRTGKPRRNETGLEGKVSLADAWSVFPYPMELQVARVNATDWWYWVDGEPQKDKLLYEPPNVRTYGDTILVATSCWALERKIPKHLVQGSQRVGANQTTRDYWIDYLHQL